MPLRSPQRQRSKASDNTVVVGVQIEGGDCGLNWRAFTCQFWSADSPTRVHPGFLWGTRVFHPQSPLLARIAPRC